MTKQHTSESEKLVSLLHQANELRSRGEYEAALQVYFFDVLHNFGESADLLAMIASCYYHLSRYYEAVFFIEKAIRLAPDDARLHAALGEYHALGTLEVERAAEEYRKAIELNPNYVEALAEAAVLLRDLPEQVVTLDEAINWLERATQLSPNNPDHHFWLGEIYWEAGRVVDAEREWVKALLCPRPLELINAKSIKKRLVNDSDSLRRLEDDTNIN